MHTPALTRENAETLARETMTRRGHQYAVLAVWHDRRETLWRTFADPAEAERWRRAYAAMLGHRKPGADHAELVDVYTITAADTPERLNVPVP